MENVMLNSNFTDLSFDEMNETDGGFVIFGIAVTLTTGAKIGIGLFAGGCAIGIAYGIFGS